MNEEPAALIVTRRPAKEMADGTLRVQIDVEPNDRRRFLDLFPDNGDPIAVVALEPDAVRNHQQQHAFAQPKPKGEFGGFAQWLVQSGFFRRLDIWKACGSDAEFLEWVKTQPCAHKDRDCAGDIVAAHVRRIQDGAGTGIKPEYAAIPLCDAHHKQQHQHGESALGGTGWFDRMRVKTVETWARERIKFLVGMACDEAPLESLTQMSPYMLSYYLADAELPSLAIPEEFRA